MGSTKMLYQKCGKLINGNLKSEGALHSIVDCFEVTLAWEQTKRRFGKHLYCFEAYLNHCLCLRMISLFSFLVFLLNHFLKQIHLLRLHHICPHNLIHRALLFSHSKSINFIIALVEVQLVTSVTQELTFYLMMLKSNEPLNN